MAGVTYPEYTQKDIVALAQVIQKDLERGQLLLSVIEEGLAAEGVNLTALIKAQLPQMQLLIELSNDLLPANVKATLSSILAELAEAERISVLMLAQRIIKLSAEFIPNREALKQKLEEMGVVNATVSGAIELLGGSYERLLEINEAAMALSNAIEAVLKASKKGHLSQAMQKEFVQTIYTRLKVITPLSKAYAEGILPVNAENPNATHQFIMSVLELAGVPQDQAKAIINGISQQITINSQGALFPLIGKLNILIEKINTNQPLLQAYEQCSQASKAFDELSGVRQTIQRIREFFQQFAAQIRANASVTNTASQASSRPARVNPASASVNLNTIEGLYPVLRDFGTICSQSEPACSEQEIMNQIAVSTGLSETGFKGLSNLRKAFKQPLFKVASGCMPVVNRENIEMAFVCYHLLKDEDSLKNAPESELKSAVLNMLQKLVNIVPGYKGWQTPSIARERLQIIQRILISEPSNPECFAYLIQVETALDKLNKLDSLVQKIAVELNPEVRKKITEVAEVIRIVRQRAVPVTVARSNPTEAASQTDTTQGNRDNRPRP